MANKNYLIDTMRNKKLNFFQRRAVPIGFKNHVVLDDFIQTSLDKFAFSEPSNEMYEAAGAFSRYIISDKSTIPDLIIYNKTFNKNDCFENCSARDFNSFPRVRFILNTQKKEKYPQQQQPKRNNKNKKQYEYEFKEIKDDRDYNKPKPTDEEEEPEWVNDDITEFKKSKIVFQAIPTGNTNEDEGKPKEHQEGEKKQTIVIEKEEERIIVKDQILQDQVKTEIKQEETTIMGHNEELKKFVTQTEEIIIANEPIKRINDDHNNEEASALNGIVKDDNREEEVILTNPNNFLAQIQEKQKKMKEKEKEKEMNDNKLIEEIKQCEDIFKTDNDTKEEDRGKVIEKDISKEQIQIKEQLEPIKQNEDNQANQSISNENISNKPIAQAYQQQIPPMMPSQGGEFAKMPFMPGVPPYMCYPFLPPFPMLNYPMNPMMNPMMGPIPPQMGMNMNISNMMPPYQFEDDEEEEDDPMMNNFNDNFNRYNPTVFLENPALIVKKNLIESNWFVMKDSKILGNYNSEQLLFYLGEQIRQHNKFEGISITDYHTDVFFKPNNLFDILRKNVPKLKKKYIQNKMQTMMMAMPMMNNNMMPNMNMTNSNANNKEGNDNPHTMQNQNQNRPMNQNKSHPSIKK